MITDKNNPNFIFDEDYFAYLIDNNIKFDTEDIKAFIECCEVEQIRENNLGRWTRLIISICQVFNKYYAVSWEAGLTEYQEDLFDDTDIVEVHPVEKEEIVIFTDWMDNDNKLIGSVSRLKGDDYGT